MTRHAKKLLDAATRLAVHDRARELAKSVDGLGRPVTAGQPAFGAPFAYWCEGCQRHVPEKRCPLCGLKARKVR